MRGGLRWVAASAALLLATPAPVAAASGVAAAPQFVTYSEEVPCPPTVRSAAVRHPRRRRRPTHVRAHSVHHVQRRATVHRARVHRPHRSPLVRAHQPIHSKRCSVLRRDRLTPASFGLTPESAVLTPADDVVEPGGPVLVGPSSGRAAFADGFNPATGGGSPGVGGGGEVVSAAPEPYTWSLMMLAVGAVGAALRRKRRMCVS